MIKYASSTDQGERKYNEDSVRIEKRGENWIFVLCDGLGGMGHGEIASGAAVDAMSGIFMDSSSFDHVLDDGINAAQDKVMQMQEENPRYGRMATTMVSLMITADPAGEDAGSLTGQWVHLGDSRLYMFRGGKIVKTTFDDSLPMVYMKLGEITRDEVRHHPDRSRLLRVIGTEWNSESESQYSLAAPEKLMKGDSFLLCSDGFWEWIEEKQMEQCLEKAKDPSEWLSDMTDLVRREGRGSNMDNYSAITVSVL